MLDISDTLWLIEIPAKNHNLLISPFDIAAYNFIPDGEKIAIPSKPFNDGYVDNMYNFYSFDMKNDIRKWCSRNKELAKALSHELSECFV